MTLYALYRTTSAARLVSLAFSPDLSGIVSQNLLNYSHAGEHQ